MNRCSECGKNFPTELFLNLHIEENHDALVAARRERGEKTVCFYNIFFLYYKYISPIIFFYVVIIKYIYVTNIDENPSTAASSKAVIENALPRKRGGCT